MAELTAQRIREIAGTDELTGDAIECFARAIASEVADQGEARPAQAPAGWKPIAEAPKDGTKYLAANSDGEYEVMNCPPGHHPGQWELIDGEWRGGASTFAHHATHFQPLPAAPSPKGTP